MKYRKGAHSVYSLMYHVIFVVKYRQNAFPEGHEIVNDAKEKLVELSGNFDVEVVEIECGVDHVHLLVSAGPTLDITRWINAVKGNTSRFLRERHADLLRDKLWGDHFWSPSYFIATTGNVSIDVLKKYIEDQRGRLAREV